MTSLILGVGLMLLALVLFLLVRRSKKGPYQGLSRRKVMKMREQSVRQVEIADRNLSTIKSGLRIEPRSKDPRVHFMCVGSAGISQARFWISFFNGSQYQVVVKHIEWELWFGDFVKSNAQKVERVLPIRGYVPDFSIEEPLSKEEVISLSFQSKEPQTRCYLEGTVLCQTPFGEFRKKFVMLELTNAITGQTLAKKAEGADVRYELDSLTGLFQRRYLEENLQKMMDTSLPEHPFSFMMVDVDDFKNVNDEYGHLVGDEALKMISDQILSTIKDKGVAIRYGGDEFCIALQCCEKDEAEYIANQILDKIKSKRLIVEEDEGNPNGPKTEIQVAVSLGVATAKEPMDYKSLMKRADEMLYQSKKAGKNQVMTDRRND